MAYGLRIRGLARDDIRRRVDEAAGLLGIGALLERKPRQLSGGQRQRVAMGRAIVRHPKLFLFDEPLSNLDAKLRLVMRAEIRRLQRRLQATSLFVTHDQVEAMTLGDRLLVLHQGQPAQLATPMEVFARPADTYVAGFIGSPTMNFLPAALARDGTAAQLAAGLMLPFGDGRRPGADGDRLIIGIRPEHLRPGAGLDLVIDLIEPLGSETLVHGHLSGGEEQSLTVKLFGPPPPGDRLTVAPQLEHLHVFDEPSGRRIDPICEETATSPLAAANTAD
jgi:sn-glycerol 3-phosphate transport system ATP-binding protein